MSEYHSLVPDLDLLYLVLNLFNLLHNSLLAVTCGGNKHGHREGQGYGHQHWEGGVVHGAWCGHVDGDRDGNYGWVGQPLCLGGFGDARRLARDSLNKNKIIDT